MEPSLWKEGLKGKAGLDTHPPTAVPARCADIKAFESFAIELPANSWGVTARVVAVRAEVSANSASLPGDQIPQASEQRTVYHRLDPVNCKWVGMHGLYNDHAIAASHGGHYRSCCVVGFSGPAVAVALLFCCCCCCCGCCCCYCCCCWCWCWCCW